MQASHTTHDFSRQDSKYKDHKPVKYVRSDDNRDQRQHPSNQSSAHNSRSLSSSFRHSIRHLTSCASARRKPGRNKHNPPTVESAAVYEDEQRNTPKTNLLSSKSSLPSQKHSNRSNGSNNQDIPPVLPPRKPLEKKNSVQMQSAILNSSLLNNSSSQISSNAVDDTSTSSLLASARILPNKEISTSLVNLMGTATDSVGVNNASQTTTTQEIRPRKHSVFSFLQRISTTPSSTVDRLGYLESLSNGGMVESPSSQRITSNGNQSNTSYTKPTNEYTWCYESSIPNHANVDECLPQLEIDDKPLTYRQQFHTTEHFNWYGYSENFGPVIISYKHSIEQNKQRSVVSIVRTRQRTSVETLYNVHSSSTPIEILRRICEQCGIQDIEYFDPVLCDGTHDLLLKYDESHVSNQHKFGVIYQCENQVTEEDIFSNETHSNAMEKFLDLIGTRVKLKDFRGFRGGLDVKSDQTGTESVYEQFQNHEIMFHVSTLLPHSKSERQQLERKRHIGNDIVGIVFQETETIFNPECIASQFLHVYIVITPVNDGTQLKVSIIQRDTVPSFGPNLPHSNLFQFDHTFKQWLLTKLINAELASCRASTIQKYHERTKMSLFENLYRTLHENNRPLMNWIVYHSQYKHECDVEQQQREEASKTPDRHGDSSLLGSVRRRFIAPKVRVQNPNNENNNKSPPAATIIITTPPATTTNNNNNNNDSRSKTRSMTMDLRRSASRESLNTNGHTTTNGNHSSKMTSFFSSSKSNTPRLDKSTTSRSLLDHDNIDSISSSRSQTKFLSPATCPSSPWTSGPTNGFVTSSSSNELNHTSDSYPHSPTTLNSSFTFNTKLSPDEIDPDPQINLSIEDLQSSSKDDLIKFILALQHHHSTKSTAQIHSNALKQLEAARQQDSP